MREILVLGGAGFLGTNLVHSLVGRSDTHVTVLDSREAESPSGIDSLASAGRIRFVRGDIRDGDLMKSILIDKDVVFHCAAQTSHSLSMRYPANDLDVNCRGTLTVLETLRQLGNQALLIYTSTTTVLGRDTRGTADESHQERPLDIYSADKLAAENLIRIYRSAFDLRAVILRFPNLYGPWGKPSPEFGFVNYFISLALADQDIVIFGEGGQLRNLLYVEDAVDVLLTAAKESRLVGQTCFAVHQEHRSVLNVAQEITHVFGRGRIRHTEWPPDRLRIEVDDVRLTGQRLFDLTGWTPRFSLQQGFERTKELLETLADV